MPTWSIIHSRHWKMQIPYLARHCRVVTFDGRGNGRSDRPSEPEAYREEEFAADALAVLDATATERAVLVSLSPRRRTVAAARRGPPGAGREAGVHRPALPLAPVVERSRAAHEFVEPRDDHEGWGKWNRDYWLDALRGLPRVLLLAVLHRAALHEAARGRDRLGAGDGCRDAGRHPACATPPGRGGRARASGPRRLPGARDPRQRRRGPPVRIRRPARGAGRRRARGARGVGPSPACARSGQGQPPAARLRRPAARRRAGCAASRGDKRALYVSSPIGLGHARRDAAIADELRQLHPDLEIDWLAQHPVTAVLEARGERIHPASAHLANESTHIESESAEHDLHCFQAIRRMDEILLANFMVFHDLVRDEDYDLWIGDEAWELDYYLHENPEQKRAAYVWLTDFVGWLPMADGGEREAFVTADYNAEMIEHIARFPRVRDRAVFVGNADDIVRGLVRPRAAADPRLDGAALRLRRLRDGLRPARAGRPRRARVPRRRARLHRHRRRLRRRGAPAATRDRRVPGGEGARAGPADGRRRRPAHRPGEPAAARRARDPRVRPRALPPPRRLRPCDRPGRADDGDGADGEPAAVPVLPAPPPLRAELPRAPPARALRRRALHGLRDRRPVRDRRGDRRGDRARGRLPPGRDGRRRARGDG